MNLLFTICARAGSKGVRGKNLRNFLEWPIIYYTLSTYQIFVEKHGVDYQSISLAINTDSKELIEQVKKTNIEYISIPRQADLAGDVISKTDVIKDTVNQAEILLDRKFEIIIDLDVTSPLRTIADIKGVLDTLICDQKADVSFSVTDSRRLPYFNMVCENSDGYYGVLIPRGYVSRQQAPRCYDMNASIYAYRREFILCETTFSVFDGNAVVWKMLDTAVLDIDNEEDFELMEVLAKYFYGKYSSYQEIYKGICSVI